MLVSASLFLCGKTFLCHNCQRKSSAPFCDVTSAFDIELLKKKARNNLVRISGAVLRH